MKKVIKNAEYKSSKKDYISGATDNEYNQLVDSFLDLADLMDPSDIAMMLVKWLSNDDFIDFMHINFNDEYTRILYPEDYKE